MTLQELERLADLQQRINRLKANKKLLEEQRTSMAINYSDMPKGHTLTDQMAEYAAKIDELERKYAEILVEHLELWERFERACAVLNRRERKVLVLRYDGIEDKRTGEMRTLNIKNIARYMHYSEAHVYRLHDKAVEKITEF